MSALWNTAARTDDVVRLMAPMTVADLDAVMAIEDGVYPFPWTRGNFIDSLASGYLARLLRDAADEDHLIGYFVAMEGADEMHLLNITVAPPHQGKGHARYMISELVARCRVAGLRRLWLEVRESNAAARGAYRQLGFVERGTRSGYYPAARGKRESAVVMSLAIDPDPEAGHALD